MKLIEPTAVTAGMLISSNVADNEWWKEPGIALGAYNAGTNYGVGVRVTSGGRVYKSIVTPNTGHAVTDPAYWSDQGPTNRWAALDEGVGSISRRLGSMQYVIEPGGIDALAILDCDGETATLSVSRGGVEIWSATKSFNAGGRAIDSWYSWFFDRIGARMNIDFEGLPLYADARITLTITGRDSGAYVQAGTIVVGRLRGLGKTETGVKFNIISFSKKEKDEFGVVRVTSRGFSKQMVARSVIPADQADAIATLLTKLRDTAVVYIGEDDFDSLFIYGYCPEFATDLVQTEGSASYLNLTAEGLSTSI